MSHINPDHIVEEIKENVKTADAMKADLVLEHLKDVNEKYRNRILFELSRADASFSIPLLCNLLYKQPALNTTAPIVRESLISQLIANQISLIENLTNPAILDKTIMIQTAGELKLEEAAPALNDLLGNTYDASQAKEIIECLGLIGDPQSLNTLTDYLYSADRQLIITAIHALGQLATPSAMHRLAERMGTDNELDLLILQIFSEVQDNISLEKINDTLRSHFAHMRTYAKKEMIKIGAKSVPVLTSNLIDSDDDFLIHTLNVLGDIGDESAIVAIRKLLSNEPKNANVRFAAYEALALLPLRKGAYTLTAGLTDIEDHVCIAAARAIDGNFNEILAAGLKNLIHAENDESKHITKIIINAQVDNIFLSLAGDESFQKQSMDFLPYIHKDVLFHYLRILRDNGHDNFAKQAEGKGIKIAPSGKTKLKVCAVDDSRMILNIYKATLHELGFEPVLFEFPAGAIAWLKSEKPAIVLTDLNMPEITGVQLTEKIREHYSKKELPIIMVTTQSDVQDHDAAYQAGINSIMPKPFNATSLKKAMSKFISVGD